MIKVTDRENGTKRVALNFDPDYKVVRRVAGAARDVRIEYYPERSKAKPEFHKDVDINRIMKRYVKTGIVDPLLYRDLFFGDFSNGSSFADMSMRVTDAMEQFNTLPAPVRQEFRNDPAKLLDFLADPANDARAIELGLKDAPVKAALDPAAAPAGNPPAPATAAPVSAPPVAGHTK